MPAICPIVESVTASPDPGLVVQAPVGPGEPFQLLFDESDGEGAALPEAFQAIYPAPWRLPGSTDRPYVYVNFVLSRDGRVSYDEPGRMSGADISGFDRFDRWLMGLLRARADAVLMGDTTLRIEPDHVWTAEFICPHDAAAFASLRRSEERTTMPHQVFLSLEGDIDFEAATIFSVPEASVIVATTERGATRAAAASNGCAARVDVLALGEESVDVSALLGALRDDYGASTVLCEGGPRTYGSLLAAGCVDDEFLALSPTVVGSSADRPRPGLVEGARFSPESSPRSRPLTLHRAGDFLFLRSRYAFR